MPSDRRSAVFGRPLSSSLSNFHHTLKYQPGSEKTLLAQSAERIASVREVVCSKPAGGLKSFPFFLPHAALPPFPAFPAFPACRGNIILRCTTKNCQKQFWSLPELNPRSSECNSYKLTTAPLNLYSGFSYCRYQHFCTCSSENKEYPKRTDVIRDSYWKSTPGYGV